RHLDLRARQARAGVSVEDLEDDLRTVQHRTAGLLFQAVRLRRRQLVLDDELRRTEDADELLQLLALAGADVAGGVERFALLRDGADDLDAERARELPQLVERTCEFVVADDAALDSERDRARSALQIVDAGRHGEPMPLPSSNPCAITDPHDRR